MIRDLIGAVVVCLTPYVFLLLAAH